MTRSAACRPPRIACVLLAAGGSQRLGMPKQLVRHLGRPLLARVVASARAAAPGAPLVVVLGAHVLRLRLVLRRAARDALVVTNPRWSKGLATSLQTGLAAVPHGTQAILVLLVDQPRVDAAALRRLLATWRRRPGLLTAARYHGQPGVPAVLPRRYWPAVRALDGDSGARALLRGASDLLLVDMPEAALDIDLPADLAKLR